VAEEEGETDLSLLCGMIPRLSEVLVPRVTEKLLEVFFRSGWRCRTESQLHIHDFMLMGNVQWQFGLSPNNLLIDLNQIFGHSFE
jgi:hypothetical protein